MISGGIYVHVPFCSKKCHYCNFYSTKYSQSNRDLYIRGMKKEIDYYADKNFLVDTIYFGGGTPSLLSYKELALILNKLRNSFNTDNLLELTIEVNPESVNKEKVKIWKDLGFNRISLGIQSFDDYYLKRIGRVHDSHDIRKALDLIKANFSNASGDLICGLPGQAISEWEIELDKIISYDLNHISIYPLQIEPETEMAKIVNEEYYNEIDDTIVDMMNLSRSKLIRSNYEHYEIANYAKPNYESKHNLIYWQFKPYLGFGPSAASFNKTHRWQNSSDIYQWAKYFKREVDEESKRNEIQMAEFAFLSLRLLNRGLNSKKFKREFGVSLESVYGDTLNRLIGYDWLTKSEDRYKLTGQAINFANQVFAEFLP
ncbi:MAG: radical SAM family heme chaperone HemW [Clostridia bacterium]